MPGKGFFAKVADTVSSNFNVLGDPDDLSKGAINAFDKVTGGSIDGSNPDGVVSPNVSGNTIVSNTPKKPDTTLERATSTDQPFSVVNTDGKSSYYTSEHASEVYIAKAVDTKGGATDREITVGPRPYSAFNKYSLINYRGNPLDGVGDEGLTKDSQRYTTIHPNTLVNPTATRIIEVTGEAKDNFGYRYQYSDFALTKYYGKIPNNQLLTLRRFAYPCGDDIITPKGLDEAGKMVSIQQPDIARAVTWLGETTGNNVADIVKFSHGYNWKDAEASVQTLQSKQGASSGKFGSMVNSSKFLSAAANASAGNDAVASNSKAQNAGYDSFSNTYPNHVFGPLNVIKNTLVRESGLKFEQEFSLKFEYELKSFEGTNPKVMMLDQLANILALTYNNAPFWGGSVRYVSDGSVAKPLGDLKKLRSGDYAGFMGSIVDSMGDMFKGIASPGGLKNLKDNKLLNNLVGGGLMKMFNTPQGGQAAAALLTGDPTGQWHLTVGNPLNPIMVIGNLAMQDCEINFEGANTLQDFPERMVVNIKLKPARPRDKAEIESMFNSGRGRFYLQPDDVADINRSHDTSAYGNKNVKPAKDDFINVFRKIANG